MKRLWLFCLLSVCACLSSRAQTSLRFDRRGEFRIVQFTDLHFAFGNPGSETVLERLEEILTIEKPDLAVLTGDIIFGRPADKSLRSVLDTVDSLGVRFCAVFGNHDDEFGLDKTILYGLMSGYRTCVMPPCNGNGPGDYVLELLSSDGSSVAGLLYMIDSNAYVFDEYGEFASYDHIHGEQIDWYRNVSASYTAAGGGKPLPGVAFFHIPLPEFKEAALREDTPLIGSHLEPVCPPDHNSGFFEAVKERGDIYAIFVGHDHDNDFALEWQEVLLAYGRYSGGNNVYGNLPGGARVIVLSEGLRRLESYIRLSGGGMVNHIVYPDSFRRR